MKKQLFAIGLASLLTLPSVVFAEATWYGAFRGIVHSAGWSYHDVQVDNGSRWGVKGSNEVSEGLTAVYQFEESIDLTSATVNDGNRLSYLGLSGGFGSITMGRIWGAAYNHVGALTDAGVWSGNSGLTDARISNAVSYAAATGPVSFQVDLVMEANKKTKAAPGLNTAGDDVEVAPVSYGNVQDRSVDASRFGLSVDTGFATVAIAGKNMATADEMTGEKNGDKKLTSFGFSAPVGGFTVAAGWHSLKMDNNTGDDTKDKQTQFNFRGPLGDTGMSFSVNVADIDKGDKTDVAHGSTPWNVHVAKSLGGGASVAFEYIDHDHDDSHMDAEKSESVVQLLVNF